MAVSDLSKKKYELTKEACKLLGVREPDPYKDSPELYLYFLIFKLAEKVKELGRTQDKADAP